MPLDFLHNQRDERFDFFLQLGPLLTRDTMLVTDYIGHHISMIELNLRFRHARIPFLNVLRILMIICFFRLPPGNRKTLSGVQR